ncbi:MAG: 30S ribosomal protein S17 [Candidatus Kerfeldbacteria bacterium]
MAEKNEQSTQVMRRRFTGTVVSDKPDKTIVVEVGRTLRHKLYSKLYKRTQKFHVHDEKNQFKEGDTVDFIECRPYSKKKRWRVVYPTQEA